MSDPSPGCREFVSYRKQELFYSGPQQFIFKYSFAKLPAIRIKVHM